MTNEELDRARGEEATRLWKDDGISPFVQVIAARLAREGWTPPEPIVDPDLVAAREWTKGVWGGSIWAFQVEAGMHDKHDVAQAFLAGIKHGREPK